MNITNFWPILQWTKGYKQSQFLNIALMEKTQNSQILTPDLSWFWYFFSIFNIFGFNLFNKNAYYPLSKFWVAQKTLKQYKTSKISLISLIFLYFVASEKGWKSAKLIKRVINHIKQLIFYKKKCYKKTSLKTLLKP